MRSALCLSLLGLAAASSVAAESIYPNPVYRSGAEPRESLALDLDRDGHQDLVSATTNSFGISILFGRGDGTFDPFVRLTTAEEPYDVLVADFDEDGFEDIVSANGNSVSVLLGFGDGTFGSDMTAVAGSFNLSLAAEDLDGDDNLDLAVGHLNSGPNGGNIAVLLGRGDGTFDPPLSTGGGSAGYFLAVADFDQDGIPDLLSDGSDAVTLYLGNGDGTFASTSSTPVGDNPRFAVVGDFNGDPWPDAAVANSVTDDVSVVLGGPGGVFAPEVRYAVGEQPQHILLDDVDGDGSPDLLVSNVLAPHVSVLTGNPDGTFDPEIRYGTVHVPGSVDLADFTGDGVRDIAVSSLFFDDAFVLPGRGDGTFVPRSIGLYTVGGQDPAALALADFDEDGIPDLVTANEGSDDVSVLLGDGNAGFPASTEFTAGACTPSAVVVGAVDAGSTPDLVVMDPTLPAVCALLGDGGGDFGAPTLDPLPANPRGMALADFDGDGVNDLAVSGGSPWDRLSVLTGHGDGSFRLVSDTAVGTDPAFVAVGNFDDNSDADLAVANVGSLDISVLLGNSSATFAPEVRYPLLDNPTSILVGDLDGNATEDLLVLVLGTLSHVFLGTGEGTFDEGPLLQLDAFPSPHGVLADLDGDGVLDLAQVPSGGGGQIAFWKGNGDATFEDPLRFATSSGFDGLVQADFNGDGTRDLANLSFAGGSILTNMLSTGIRFAGDKVSLTWTLLLGVDSYNVYRGPLSFLVDGNDDGLPDGGFGTCQNAFDADTTDNVFTDPELPGAGTGFFYLRSRVGPQGETDLGTTSAGSPRSVTPCP